jgi:hypothetical protein
MKSLVGPWLKAGLQQSKAPVRIVAAALLLVVSGATLSTIKDKGGETMQLSVRTDSLQIRTAGPLTLAPVLVRKVTFLGAKTVTVSGAPGMTLRGDDTCFIEDVPTPAGPALARPSPARLRLRFGAAQEVEFLRQRESKESSYYAVRGDPTTPSDPAEAGATMTLQPGQQVRLNDKVIFPSEEYPSEHGGQIAIEGDHGFQAIFLAVQPDVSHLVPTAIAGLGFLRGPTGPVGPDTVLESGLLGGDLAFLNMPGNVVTLRQGANLILEGLDATLQSISFAEDAIVANVSGEVNEASLQVGHTRRVVQPTWFDFVLSSRLGRAVIGVIAVLVGLLSNIEKLHLHVRKVTRDPNEPNHRTAEE